MCTDDEERIRRSSADSNEGSKGRLQILTGMVSGVLPGLPKSLPNGKPSSGDSELRERRIWQKPPKPKLQGILLPWALSQAVRTL